MSIAVLSCHFNPAGFRRPERNVGRFCSGLAAQGIRPTIAELAFNGQPHRLPPVADVVRLRSDSVLWQKERLLNHLEARLPPEVTKVVFCDADLLFESRDWLARTEDALDRFDAVQPFSGVVYLGPDVTSPNPGVPSLHKSSACADKARGGDADPGRTSIGLAWAFRRDFLRKTGGLYDRGILGGGDTFLNWGLWRDDPVKRYSAAMNSDVQSYIDRVRAAKPRVGYVDGDIYHLFHGHESGRRYGDRYEIVRRHGYDPASQLVERGGVWEWRDVSPEFREEVANYFVGREEDA